MTGPAKRDTTTDPAEAGHSVLSDAGLEPVGIQNFGGGALVECRKPVEQWIVQPVVGVDEIQVVPRGENPAKARLPADHRALTVVLHVICKGEERRELCFAGEPEQPG